MRMPGPQIGFQTGSERSILNAFVQLKKMWMSRADANPDDVRPALARKYSHANDREKKCAPANRDQSVAQSLFRARLDVPKKTKGEVHLFWREPTHAAQIGIQSDENLPD